MAATVRSSQLFGEGHFVSYEPGGKEGLSCGGSIWFVEDKEEEEDSNC